MAIIARAGWPARANSASRSPPAGSRARFRRQLLAIPATRRPKHRQPRDHGQPMKPGVSIGETQQPFPGAPDDDHHRQPQAGQIGQIRASRSLPAGSGARSAAGTRSRSRQPAGQGTANHGTKANPMKPGASIGETRQPFPGAPDDDHRRQPPAGQIGQPRAPRSPLVSSGARFRWQLLAIPATRRTRQCQAREHGQTRRLDRSLPVAAPGSAAGTPSRSRQPAGQSTAKHATTGTHEARRLDR